MSEWTEFDLLMFAWRAIVFLFVTVIFIVASIIVRNTYLLSDENPECSPRRQKSRWAISIILYSIGVAVGIFSIYELIANNPNEWIVLKISLYIIIWVFAVFAPTSVGDGISFLMCIATIIIAGSTICSCIICVVSPRKTEKTIETLDSRTLVAVNDGVQETGKAGSVIFFTTFAIFENGVYNYYWQDESGGIRRDFVDSDLTKIYYTKSGEQPHLDKIVYVTHTFFIRNKQQHENLAYGDVLYELYIPEGSIAGSYSLDLQ